MISNVQKLFNKSIDILQRDIQRLSDLAITEKLSHANSQDLVAYIKLLREIKVLDETLEAERMARAQSRAKRATTGQLEALKRINEGRKRAKGALHSGSPTIQPSPIEPNKP